MERLLEKGEESLSRTARITRDRDDWDLAAGSSKRFEHLWAGKPGHADVDEENVGEEPRHCGEGGGARGHRQDLVSFGGEQIAQHVQNGGVIVGNEDSDWSGLHVSTSPPGRLYLTSHRKRVSHSVRVAILGHQSLRHSPLRPPGGAEPLTIDGAPKVLRNPTFDTALDRG
jgi:hypothetical protein